MRKTGFSIIFLFLLLTFITVGCAAGEKNFESDTTPSVDQLPSEPNSASETQTPWDNEYGINFFLVPEMTAEQQSYFTDYVEKLLYSGLLIVDWSMDDYSSIMGEQIDRLENYMIFAFEDIIGTDEMQKLFNEYNGIFPAPVIEDVLLERFPFTAGQLREILSHIYDAQTNTYHYEGGRGGGPIEAAVTYIDRFSENGQEFLRLTYELYTGYSGLDYTPSSYNYKRPGVLTLIQNSGNDYKYWSVEVGEETTAPSTTDSED